MPTTQDAKNSPPTIEFTLPTNSVFALLPPSITPYIEITRMHIPPLNLVCYYPFIIGILLAASTSPVHPSATDLLVSLVKAYPIALLSGSFGHALDDVVDYSIDIKYPRCASRPIIRGAISWTGGLVYSGFLLGALLIAVRKFYGEEYMRYGVLFSVLAYAYPASKRVWNYPQAVLLVLHASPIPWMAMAHDQHGSSEFGFPAGSLALAAAFGTNTMIFDIGYGLLDAKEDRKNGVGSMAARFQGQIKTVLTGLGIMNVCLLVLSGLQAGLGLVWFIGCGLKVMMLGYLLRGLDVNSTQSAIEFFMGVANFGGAFMICSLLGEYVCRMVLV